MRVLGLLEDEDGQDLVEYSLLMAFIVMAAIEIMQKTGTSISPIWLTANTVVANAASSVS